MMKTAVVASKLMDNNEVVGTMVNVELPGISLGTQDVSGAGFMGTASLPTTGQVESMETTIGLRGMSGDQALLMRAGVHDLCLRFAQDSVSVQNGVVPEGCKIYMRTVFKSTDSGSIESNNPIEGSVVHEVLRYLVYTGGKETLLVDKTAHIFRVNGVDQMEDVRKLID